MTPEVAESLRALHLSGEPVTDDQIAATGGTPADSRQVAEAIAALELLGVEPDEDRIRDLTAAIQWRATRDDEREIAVPVSSTGVWLGADFLNAASPRGSAPTMMGS